MLKLQIANLPDETRCSSLLDLLMIGPPRHHSEPPHHITHRLDELHEPESRLGQVGPIGRNEEGPFVRRIAELEITLGQLRRMSDGQIVVALGVSSRHDKRFGQPLPDAVPKVRALIGSAQPAAGRTSPAIRVSTPLQRDTRKCLDRVYGRIERGEPVDTLDCFLCRDQCGPQSFPRTWESMAPA